jgi:oligoribonuclease (3'-5' exoribonuclease)
MKYVSLDIETTSLEPAPENILQIAMVVEDTSQNLPLLELPKFVCFIDQGEFKGQPYALALNGWILKEICAARQNKATKWPVLKPHQVVPALQAFLHTHFGNKNAVAAGKNVAGFDMQFLPTDLKKMFKHRVLDPGCMFIDWATDDAPPGLEICKRRCGLEGVVSHDAYEDALDVIAVMRTKYQQLKLEAACSLIL